MKRKIAVSALCAFLIGLQSPELLSGQPAWEAIGPEGGPILKMIQDRNQTHIFYAVTNAFPCTVYRSTNSGDSWISVSFIYDTIYDLTSGNGMVYASGNTRIYYSQDMGENWNFHTVNDHYFFLLQSDPSNAQILHACGYHNNEGRGLYAYFRSTDQGQNWQDYDYLDSWNYSIAYGFAVDPTNTNRVYIAGYGYDGTDYHSILLRSTNSGASWSMIIPAAEGNIFNDVAVDGSGKLYAVTYYSLYSSSTAGQSWNAPVWGGGRKIALDPSQTNVLYTGLYAAIYRSTDGGSTMHYYSSGLNGDDCTSLLVSRGGSRPLFFANSRGLFKSVNAGVDWAFSSAGITCARISALKCAPSSPNILFAASDNDALYFTQSAIGKQGWKSGVEWMRLSDFAYGNSVSAIGIDKNNPQIVFALSPYG